jgi:hypothetical protein
VRDRGALNFWRPAEELVGFRLGHSPQSDEGLVQQGNRLAGPENRPKDLLHLGSGERLDREPRVAAAGMPCSSEPKCG